MITVKVASGQFKLNGVTTQLRMRTSFKWLGWLWHDEVAKAEKWLDRVRDQGFHGIRVLGEHHFWGGPFYGLYPLIKPWNLRMHGGSGFHMSDKHRSVLAQALGLLRKHELIMEYVVIATIKGTDGSDPRPVEQVVGWNSHAMRVVAEFFRSIDATNVLPETINECDAHIVPRFETGGNVYSTRRDDGRLSDKYVAEMANEARRWKKRDWPGSPIGLSQGAWDFQYPVGTHSSAFTHCNVHTPRRGEWERVGAGIETLQRQYPQCPVYLNENIHHMSQAQWDTWVPQIPKWAGLSTTNAARIQDQWNTAYQHGASYCVHDLVGQATDPDAEWTRLEELHKEQFNADPPPPPPPPPPPTPPPDFWQRLANAFKRLWEWLKERLGL